MCGVFGGRGSRSESLLYLAKHYPRESVKFRPVVSDVQSSGRPPAAGPAFRSPPDGSSELRATSHSEETDRCLRYKPFSVHRLTNNTSTERRNTRN
jgi:hypothetical protein